MTRPTDTSTSKRKRVKRSSQEDMMLGSVAKYLEKKGWRVLVIGASRIQQQPGDAAFNYEFVFRFTGKKKDADS